MTRAEFMNVIAYITAGCGRTLSTPSLEVYFDLLGDLEYQTLLTAAKRVLLEHPWATFPSIAELRAAAAVTATKQIGGMTSGEAWELAWRIQGNTDPEVEGSYERASKGAPPLVLEAIRIYGLNALCYGKEPITVIRSQFLKIYEQLVDRQQQQAMLPPAVQQAITGGPTKQIEANRSTVGRILTDIGTPKQ